MGLCQPNRIHVETDEKLTRLHQDIQDTTKRIQLLRKASILTLIIHRLAKQTNDESILNTLESLEHKIHQIILSFRNKTTPVDDALLNLNNISNSLNGECVV